MTKEEHMWTISSGRTRKLRAALEHVKRVEMHLSDVVPREYNPNFHRLLAQVLSSSTSLKNSLEAISRQSAADEVQAEKRMRLSAKTF